MSHHCNMKFDFFKDRSNVLKLIFIINIIEVHLNRVMYDYHYGRYPLDVAVREQMGKNFSEIILSNSKDKIIDINFDMDNIHVHIADKGVTVLVKTPDEENFIEFIKESKDIEKISHLLEIGGNSFYDKRKENIICHQIKYIFDSIKNINKDI